MLYLVCDTYREVARLCDAGAGVFVGRAAVQGEERWRPWSHHRCPSRVSRCYNGAVTSRSTVSREQSLSFSVHHAIKLHYSFIWRHCCCCLLTVWHMQLNLLTFLKLQIVFKGTIVLFSNALWLVYFVRTAEVLRRHIGVIGWLGGTVTFCQRDFSSRH